jgi:cation diffusion facilitator family transporter
MGNDATSNTAGTERKGLMLSVIGAVFMAVLGVGFFVLSHSQAVLLDGIFSLIGGAVGLITLRVATLIRRPDDERFHFGYAAYEPMVNLAKGLLIGAVTLFALVVAVDAILQGGRPVRGGVAVVYAVVAAVGCLTIWLLQRRAARRTGSPLLLVDAKNWLVDGLISGAVAAAFLTVVLLEGTALEWLLPYADPAIVVALSIASAPIPIRIVRSNWHQLLGRAPDAEVLREARRRVDEALEGIDGITPHLRLLETGRTFYLQVYLLVAEGADPDGLEGLDRIRERVHRSVRRDDAEVGLDVIFTRDPVWWRRTTPTGSARRLNS